jgi:hypothetical protein
MKPWLDWEAVDGRPNFWGWLFGGRARLGFVDVPISSLKNHFLSQKLRILNPSGKIEWNLTSFICACVIYMIPSCLVSSASETPKSEIALVLNVSCIDEEGKYTNCSKGLSDWHISQSRSCNLLKLDFLRIISSILFDHAVRTSTINITLPPIVNPQSKDILSKQCITKGYLERQMQEEQKKLLRTIQSRR